jgi:hypothetical protein
MKTNMKSNTNYCAWCGAPTKSGKIELPETPILEFLEEKIDKLGRERVWDVEADWSVLDLNPDDEAELLIYDELQNTFSLKYVCEKCLKDDNDLFIKYYGEEEDIDGNEIRFDLDF